MATIFGTNGPDSRTGTNEDDVIYGQLQGSPPEADLGNDTLSGGNGADVIYGWGGDDSLSGDLANDTLYGGAGNDLLKDFYADTAGYLYGPAGGLFFVAFSALDGADALYLIQGNTLIPHWNGQPFTGAGLQNGFIGFNGFLYFSANGHLNKLNQFTGASVIAGIDDTAGEHGGFVEFNNKLYFFAEVGGTTQLMSLTASWSRSGAR